MWDNRVQLKLQAELDQIAASRSATSATNEEEFFFTNDDRINLPYANAIIEVGFFINFDNIMNFTVLKLKESLRCSVVIPFVFPRRVIRDTKIGDQTIQKDTIVVYETSAVFADEKVSLICEEIFFWYIYFFTFSCSQIIKSLSQSVS